MTERAQKVMSEIWDARNTTCDTEQKLVAAILRITSENIIFYNTQNNLVVLCKEDLLNLANELEEIS